MLDGLKMFADFPHYFLPRQRSFHRADWLERCVWDLCSRLRFQKLPMPSRNLLPKVRLDHTERWRAMQHARSVLHAHSVKNRAPCQWWIRKARCSRWTFY